MPRTDLASLSNMTLYLAMGVLTLAMIAFAVHVAFAPVATRRHHRQQTPEHAEAGLVTASAGQTGGPSRSGGVGVLTEDPADRLVDEPGDEAGPTDPPERASRGRLSGRVGMSLSWLGAMLLVASVTLRGLSVHRAPVGNMFEFAVFGAMMVMVVYLVLALRHPLRWLGLFVVFPVLVTLGLALTVWYVEAAELLPALKSVWLSIHVPVATLGVAFFTIAFCVLLLYLVKARRETQVAAGTAGGGLGRHLDALPSARVLDRTAYSLNVVAFPLWTFSLIAGAIWAQQAWGSYWNWDPKETWTFVIWVIYAAYLHARVTSGWSLRTANILALLGYLAVIINFAVVNVYFVGQHSYSGLG